MPDPNSLPEPIKNLGKAALSKAADKFVDFIITKSTGKSIKIFEAEGDIEADKVRSRWEEIEKPFWLQAEAVKMGRQYNNLGMTLKKAAQNIETEENRITADNDFFWGLTEHAKEITNEKMQDLIAKIMAGEYNTPGSYSMSTLQIIKSLSKTDLDSFAFFGSFYLSEFGFLEDFFSMEKSAMETRQKLGINYSDFLELQNLGLIQAGNYTVAIDREKGSTITIFTAGGKMIVKATRDFKNWNFPPCHNLTSAGREILHHLPIKKSEIFVEWLKKYLESKGLSPII